ncbi:FKBP-type peptidyl-prolyl cis-trans isomerase [Rickettsia endosymbiont of Cardiosporidium cionae]|uniref:hypothetical protein n=1 Tax=Rickettsia endosymbiont of Cardiosporidium cionae TaxID=2777155 RepID=UPI00189414F6|nr:hypothetical protein [Rickettsia endosymbiont of Cardiosporidium cionae]KAF8818878.1 peptidyl-prolyl cis-trans isomerase [Rickettsia endosymbiont of Cardiosporidium cionae]
MKKISILFVVAFIIYVLFKQYFTENKTTTDLNIAKEQLKNINDLFKEEYSYKKFLGSFIEKKISVIASNVLKTEQGQKYLDKIFSNITLNDSENLLRYHNKVNKLNIAQSLFNIQTYGKGSIGPVICGQKVTFNYKISKLDEKIIFSGKKTINLGNREFFPELDVILVGMNVGETRESIIENDTNIYSTLGTSNEKYHFVQSNNPTQGSEVNLQNLKNIKISVTLEDISPIISIDDKKIKIFNDKTSYGIPVLCGEKINFNMNITELESSKIFDEFNTHKKIHMRIGDTELPMIFSYVINEKLTNNNLMFICKGDLLQNIEQSNINFLEKYKIIDDKHYMIEISSLSID